MKHEVDKLVRNLLCAGRPVSMPGVGTLSVTRRGARRLSRRLIEPPCRAVDFSSQESEPTLVDYIARAASCAPAQARDIYDRWLEKSRGEDALVIEGVGRLVEKRFVADEAFDAALNPQGHAPERIKRRRDGWLWAVAALAVFVALACMLVVGNVIPDPFHPRTDSASVAAEVPARTAVPEAVPAADLQTQDAIHQDEPTAPSAAEAAPPVQEMRPQQPEASEPEQPGYTQSGHRYVVLGIYSTEQNARRAAAQAEKKDAALKSRIYRYGERYLVSIFESEEEAAAQEYARKQRGTFPDVWVYTKR